LSEALVAAERIIAGCKNKDQASQKALYSFLLPYLKPIASRYLRNNQFVLDVLQESFVRIFLDIDQYDSNKGDINSWATKIVINKSINYNNRIIGLHTFEIENDEIVEMPNDLSEENHDKESLLKILNKMPRGYFEVFNLYVIDGYDHQEIASILGISAELSRKKLSRARAWLKKGTFMKQIVVIILLFISCF